MTNPQPPRTFESIASTKAPLSDAFIERALDQDLPRGGKYFLKSFFDQIPADHSDIEFAGNVEQVITFRNELSDLVVNNLKLSSVGPLESEKKSFLSNKLRSFKQKTTSDKQVVSDYLHERVTGVDSKYPSSAYEYYGLAIPTTNGGTVDLLTGGMIEGVRSNVFMQRELSALFVHFTSKEYLKEQAKGNNPRLEKRIYLNPRIVDSVKVFEDVFTSAQDAGLAIKGKILDRSLESRFMNSGFDRDKTMRGDGIVFYASAEEANDLLEIVRLHSNDNRDAFVGRKISLIPRRVVDGIAIGDEPVDKPGESLTSHRSDVMDSVLALVRRQEKPGIDRKKLFRNLWEKAALEANINPENIAFNAQPRTKK